MTGVKEFFDGLESRADASKTAGMTNSYLFDIDGAGKWTVKVEEGQVSVSEGGDDADAVITASYHRGGGDSCRHESAATVSSCAAACFGSRTVVSPRTEYADGR